jgi:hypothetical protein
VICKTPFAEENNGFSLFLQKEKKRKERIVIFFL